MLGQMQNQPLLINSILDHANLNYSDREIVTRLVDNSIHRQTYADAHLRARKMSQALVKLGFKKGDVIATMAWNSHRHLESWYAITGMGGVYHTLNPRLFAEQLDYIINHAEDQLIFLDTTFIPILEGLQDKLPLVKGYIIMTDEASMPETSLNNAHCYETLINEQDGDYNWLVMDENDACGICYTSGTTGNPKGVVYSHRSNVLHTLVVNGKDVMGFGAQTVILPVVPMFHANAWGIAFSAPAVGAKIVNPGMAMDGASIYELLDTEKVTDTAAVPTIWMMLLQYIEENNLKLPYLKRVTIGGSAAPRMMIEKFERDYGVSVNHAWGMTETSPLGTIGAPKYGMEDFGFEETVNLKLKQGRPPYLVSLKITDDDNNELPRDGVAFGNLKVKGPFIVGEYLKGEGGNILDEDGYFDTGDVATIDPQGFIQITDRAKDVVKSGGEWISSIEIENIAVGHPDVAEAAVIGLPHPKWDERPLLIVCARDGAKLTKEAVLEHLDGKIAKWWMPDDVAFVDEIPHTATGKIQKTTLREQFKDHELPTLAEG
ncbi:MAG: long-chain-fatty-acid--CoA ligase [Parvibaculales bacterium]